eukprot:4955263-Alexandrium_andersonii.AAC.1
MPLGPGGQRPRGQDLTVRNLWLVKKLRGSWNWSSSPGESLDHWKNPKRAFMASPAIFWWRAAA